MDTDSSILEPFVQRGIFADTQQAILTLAIEPRCYSKRRCTGLENCFRNDGKLVGSQSNNYIMNTLPQVMQFKISTLQTSGIFKDVHVVETKQFSALQFAIKVRTVTKSDNFFQVRIYQNEEYIDYAYQYL